MAIFEPKNNGRIAVRVYGQGFGDCILVAVRPKADADVEHILIDCGIANASKRRNDKLREVIADVKESTGGKLKVLAITHEHYDHVAGWHQTLKAWDDFTSVGEMWLAWTQKEGHPLADEIRNSINYKTSMAMAMSSAPALDELAANPEARVIFGLNVEYSKATGQALVDAIKFATDRGARVRYFEPGEVETWSDDCHFVFMGPPLNRDLIFQDLWRAGQPHMALDDAGNPLSEGHQVDRLKKENLGMARSLEVFGVDPKEDEELARIRAALGLGTKSRPPAPFDERFKLTSRDSRWRDLKSTNAAADHRNPVERYESEPWRQIAASGSVDLGRLALQMDNLTNNTSLVFAIRIAGRYYLFVGDAQVGNWYGWDRTYTVDGQRFGVDEILGNTRFYKVGHHGSHNATMLVRGLNKMPQGVVSIVPTEPNFYNGVPEEDHLLPLIAQKGPMMRTDQPRAEAPFDLGQVSSITGRARYVEFHD